MAKPPKVKRSEPREPKSTEGKKDPADWDSWISHRRLRAELNVGSGTVYELLKEANVAPHVGEDGTKRYPPDTIERVKPYLLDTDSEKPEAVGSDLMKSAAGLVKTSEEHARLLVDVMVKPLQLALDVTSKTIERLQARCEILESGRDAAAKAREDLLSEVAARDIATREHEATERRKSEAWDLLLKRAPVLLDQIQGSILGKAIDKNPDVQKQVQAAIELLQLIKPDQLSALRESGFLSKEQLAKVDLILSVAPRAPTDTNHKTETKQGN